MLFRPLFLALPPSSGGDYWCACLFLLVPFQLFLYKWWCCYLVWCDLHLSTAKMPSSIHITGFPLNWILAEHDHFGLFLFEKAPGEDITIVDLRKRQQRELLLWWLFLHVPVALLPLFLNNFYFISLNSFLFLLEYVPFCLSFLVAFRWLQRREGENAEYIPVFKLEISLLSFWYVFLHR